MSASLLVIGYGNELRGDDALGPRLARIVADWGQSGIRSLDIPQLAPELVDEIAGADRVVFADADSSGSQMLTFVRLQPWFTPGIGHTSDPAGLLALTEQLHGHCPEAWLLALPATTFELGAELSDPAWKGLDLGLVWIRQLQGLSLEAAPSAKERLRCTRWA